MCLAAPILAEQLCGTRESEESNGRERQIAHTQITHIITHTHTQRLHPSLLCSPSDGVAIHTGSSKITSPSTTQNQHRHPSRRKDLSYQHGLYAALPSTMKHGTVHALIFLVCSQPFDSHNLQWADVHKSTPKKATVIAQALAMSVGVCMDPLLARAGRQPAAGALVPVHRLQHGKRKWPIPDVRIPTSSTNTLVASRHSSAHPGMPKSDVELSASNATIPHTCRLHQRRHTNYKQHPPHDFRTSFRHTATRQTEVFVTTMHLLTQSHSPCATHGSSTHVVKKMFLGSVLSTRCSGK
ncbi:hypothetical protein TCDM_10015 [Trypanosoma cruzi Dm28c]|uniref:Uncharacterized protein n=1 Tax=Trypanosoma cruzi Dm28c TaxID=1416333 RepID=V5B8H9_TRYCR|nr:hypothetical protein TCDM_10015 [Trypanosoma cruzi Dm28c]